MELVHLSIELTNACASYCSFCTNTYSKRRVEHMDLSLLEKIANECNALKLGSYNGNPIVGICGLGEPMLHPLFEEAMRIMSRVPRVGVGTNGHLLGKHIDTLIKNRVSEVCISLDGFTRESSKAMRPGVDYDAAVNGAILLIEELKKQKEVWWEKIYIQNIVTRVTKDEVNDYARFWLSHIEGLPGGIVYLKTTCPMPVPTGHRGNKYYPSPKDTKVDEWIRKHPQVQVDDFTKQIRFKQGCQLFDRFAQILSDGTYSPCCLNSEDVWGIGNLKEMTLEECFYSTKLDELRMRNKNDIDFCRDCK